MRSIYLSLMLLTTANAFAIAHADQELSTPIAKAIYGEDNRIESYLHTNQRLVELSHSVAGQVHYKALNIDPSNEEMYDFDRYTLGEEFSLCPDQNFIAQNMLMGCSGVLIEPDLLLTASHCVAEEKDCRDLRWVFDFTNDREQIPVANVYSCKQVVSVVYEKSTKRHLDYALVRLDRKAEGRKPMPYRQKGQVLPNTPLAIIGHPSGLPLKIADSAKVALVTKKDIPQTPTELLQSVLHDRYVFKANLDAFEGNSGSPVINTKTYELEGILIEGAEDYELVDLHGDGSEFCRKVNRIDDKLWYAEEIVQRISAIKELKK